MTTPCIVREVSTSDYALWRPLWDGYNAFYGRAGESALPERITRLSWQRFLDPQEPMHALVAEDHGALVGLAHYLYHRSTIRPELSCYLSDLYTLPSHRGRGIGRSLIERVYAQCRSAGVQGVYWQTHESNAAGRRLYDTLARYDGFIVYDREL
jgi:GNAT superfamily N-acetyltransferase